MVAPPLKPANTMGHILDSQLETVKPRAALELESNLEVKLRNAAGERVPSIGSQS